MVLVWIWHTLQYRRRHLNCLLGIIPGLHQCPEHSQDSANRPRQQVRQGPLQKILSVHGQVSVLRSMFWKCLIYQQEDSCLMCGSLRKLTISSFPVAFRRVTLNKPQTLDHSPLAHPIPRGQMPFCRTHSFQSHLQENPGLKNSQHVSPPWLRN